MVYKKSYKKRYKKSYRKRNPASGSSNSTLRTVGQVASTALNIAKFAASVLNVEDKYLDTSVNFQPNITAAMYDAYNLIPQGTDNTQRIGRQVRLKSIHWRANITMDPGLETAHCCVYLLIDKKHDSSNSKFPVNNYINAIEELSFRNENFHNRFITLKRQAYTFVKNGGNRARHVEIYKDLTNIPEAKTEYDGTGATLGDVSAYPIYVMVVSSSPLANPLDVRSKGRIRFIDN